MNMRPTITSNNCRNRALGHAKQVRDFLMGHRAVQLSDLSHLFNGELGIEMALSSTWIPSALFKRVLNVVLLGSKKKMVRSDAVSDIAAVENEHSIGNGSVGQFPRETMRCNGDAVTFCLAVSSPSEDPTPEPTRARFVDLSPESINRISVAIYGTEMPIPFGFPRVIPVETFSTAVALELHLVDSLTTDSMSQISNGGSHV